MGLIARARLADKNQKPLVQTSTLVYRLWSPRLRRGCCPATSGTEALGKKVAVRRLAIVETGDARRQCLTGTTPGGGDFNLALAHELYRVPFSGIKDGPLICTDRLTWSGSRQPFAFVSSNLYNCDRVRDGSTGGALIQQLGQAWLEGSLDD